MPKRHILGWETLLPYNVLVNQLNIFFGELSILVFAHFVTGLSVPSYEILTTTCTMCSYCPLFTEGEIEAQRDQVTCSRHAASENSYICLNP